MTAKALQEVYPWLKTPLVVSAPMRPAAGVDLAVEISRAGGFGFMSSADDWVEQIQKARKSLELTAEGTLPIGVGFLLFLDELEDVTATFAKTAVDGPPAAAWLYAPESSADLRRWSVAIKEASKGLTRIWVQVGSVEEALDAVKQCGKDVVIVAQGSDAGGHGLVRGASIVTLVPGVIDALAEAGYQDVPVIAAGGIVEARTAAAAFVLGASGVLLGTRLLTATEAAVPPAYQQAIIDAVDGGQETIRTRLYDSLRGKDWPSEFDGRGLINQSWVDEQGGMPLEENRRRFQESSKDPKTGYGQRGRLVTYSGAGVGLIKEVMLAAAIVEEIQKGVEQIRQKMSA